ncbi:MAG: hypothetical protein U1F49_06545 [Rubrivivax sp.]
MATKTSACRFASGSTAASICSALHVDAPRGAARCGQVHRASDEAATQAPASAAAQAMAKPILPLDW